jgi:hypothetical protein
MLGRASALPTPSSVFGAALKTALALSCIFSSSASSQQATATMSGTIVDIASDLPLSGVSVYLAGIEKTALTGADGGFTLGGIQVGTYELIFRKIGYRVRGFRFSLSRNHLGEINLGSIGIEAFATELEEIVVEETAGGARLKGFFERMERGFGDFVSRKDIDRLDPIASTDLLRTVPGLDVRCRGTECQVGVARQIRPLGQSVIGTPPGDVTTLGDGLVEIGRNQNNVASDARDIVGSISGRAAYFCPMRYFVDGVPYDAASGINHISPDMIEGIEVYKGPANTPARYAAHGGPCGVIVVWTRRPD